MKSSYVIPYTLYFVLLPLGLAVLLYFLMNTNLGFGGVVIGATLLGLPHYVMGYYFRIAALKRTHAHYSFFKTRILLFFLAHAALVSMYFFPDRSGALPVFILSFVFPFHGTRDFAFFWHQLTSNFSRFTYNTLFASAIGLSFIGILSSYFITGFAVFNVFFSIPAGIKTVLFLIMTFAWVMYFWHLGLRPLKNILFSTLIVGGTWWWSIYLPRILTFYGALYILAYFHFIIWLIFTYLKVFRFEGLIFPADSGWARLGLYIRSSRMKFSALVVGLHVLFILIFFVLYNAYQLTFYDFAMQNFLFGLYGFSFWTLGHIAFSSLFPR